MRIAWPLFALFVVAFAEPTAAAVCLNVNPDPAIHTTPLASDLRTTSTNVVVFPAAGGTWHMRSCHVIANPAAGSPVSQLLDIDWTNSTISSASVGLGGGPVPSPCDVLGGFGRIGATGLAGGSMTAECCYLAEISQNGCLASDPSCTCDDPGNLVVDVTVVPNLVYQGSMSNPNNNKCGLLGVEVLGVLAYARWRSARRKRTP